MDHITEQLLLYTFFIFCSQVGKPDIGTQFLQRRVVRQSSPITSGFGHNSSLTRQNAILVYYLNTVLLFMGITTRPSHARTQQKSKKKNKNKRVDEDSEIPGVGP